MTLSVDAPGEIRQERTTWLGKIRNWLQSIFFPWSVARTPPDPSNLAEFSRNVTEASALLGFLLREREHISDQIIDDIEAARERLQNPAPPSKEERARLLKAYRDLVATPRISVAFDGIPPTRFWAVNSPWRSLFLSVSVALPILLLIIVLLIASRYWYWSAAFSALSMFAIWTLYTFTGVVTDYKLNQIIRFCYIFIALSLTASVLPFLIPSLFVHRVEAPLGVLRGCAAPIVGQATPPGTGAAADFPPLEVRCQDGAQGKNYQWIVRIGGIVEGWGGDPIATVRPKPDPSERYWVRGGIVVPLYIIVLALFGGTISMTRRIPEYQRRAMDAQDQLTNVQAREYLVFQIMQVASAPLIAVTAYYVVNPQTPTISVLLGFGSGFASEPILLMIRGLVEKISPTTRAQPGAVTVRVTPSTATVAPKQGIQFSAKVLGSSNTEVTWLVSPPDANAGTISQSGYYLAPDAVPATAVTVTARSVADPTKSGGASVKIEPIAVKVTPAAATLRPSQEQQFSAEVSGSSNSGVTWLLDPPGAGSGSISSNGKYTAPPSIAVASVTVIARSAADTNKSGSAAITLQP